MLSEPPFLPVRSGRVAGEEACRGPAGAVPSKRGDCRAPPPVSAPSRIPRHPPHSSQSHLFKMERNHLVLFLNLPMAPSRDTQSLTWAAHQPFPSRPVPSPAHTQPQPLRGSCLPTHRTRLCSCCSFWVPLSVPHLYTATPVSGGVTSCLAFLALHVSPPPEALPSPPGPQLTAPTAQPLFLTSLGFTFRFGSPFTARSPPDVSLTAGASRTLFSVVLAPLAPRIVLSEQQMLRKCLLHEWICT